MKTRHSQTTEDPVPSALPWSSPWNWLLAVASRFSLKTLLLTRLTLLVLFYGTDGLTKQIFSLLPFCRISLDTLQDFYLVILGPFQFTALLFSFLLYALLAVLCGGLCWCVPIAATRSQGGSCPSEIALQKMPATLCFLYRMWQAF